MPRCSRGDRDRGLWLDVLEAEEIADYGLNVLEVIEIAVYG